MNLDAWRHLLWVQALGDEHKEIADEVYRKWLELRFFHLRLEPAIEALLLGLRPHYLIGLITNGTSRAQWEKVRRLRLQSLFDVVRVSGDLPWEKPRCEIFHEACEFLGVRPQNCLMVGDKLETDILGGIQAKLGGTVWVPLTCAELGQAAVIQPDFVIGSVLDLPSLLPKNPKLMKARKGRGWVAPPDLDDASSNSSDGS